MGQIEFSHSLSVAWTLNKLVPLWLWRLMNRIENEFVLAELGGRFHRHPYGWWNTMQLAMLLCLQMPRVWLNIGPQTPLSFPHTGTFLSTTKSLLTLHRVVWSWSLSCSKIWSNVQFYQMQNILFCWWRAEALNRSWVQFSTVMGNGMSKGFLNSVQFKFKMDTDLYTFAKARTTVYSLEVWLALICCIFCWVLCSMIANVVLRMALALN